MNGVIHAVRLELNKPSQKVSLSMRRGDTSTQHLRITLSRNGAVLDLSETVMAVFKATKPDGTKIYNDCTISGDEIFLSITNQTIITVGEVRCNVEVVFRNEDTLTSPEFFIYVYENQQAQDDYVESTNEYRAAAAIVSTSTENADRAEAAAQSITQTYTEVQGLAAQVQADKDVASEKSAQAVSAADRADLSAGSAASSAESAASSAESAASAAATAAQDAAEQAAAGIVEEMEGLVGQTSEYARQALVSKTYAEEAALLAQSHAEYTEECKTEAEEAASNANTAEQNAFMSAASASDAAELAAAYANDAQLHDSAASTYADRAHDWAIGPTGSGYATDTNNAKYWSNLAAQYAQQFGSAVKWKASIYFASIPTTGMQNGDFYNIKDAFTTDSRFEEGAGISVLPGADIVWGSDISKWNIFTPSTYPTFNTTTDGLVPKSGSNTGKFLKGDGSWDKPQDTTYSTFNTTTDGLVPKSGANTSKFLKGDGNWDTPTDTTYSTFNTTTDGLTPKSGANTDKYLQGNGTWSKPQDTTYNVFNIDQDGLVPGPDIPSTDKFLSSTGDWRVPYDYKVQQSNSDANSNRCVLLATNPGTTQDTGVVYKSSNFTANPSTGKLHAPTLDSTNLIVGNVYASVEAARLAITGSASGTWPEGVEFYVQSGGGIVKYKVVDSAVTRQDAALKICTVGNGEIKFDVSGMSEYAAQWNNAIVMPNCVIFNFAFYNSSKIDAWAGFMHIENIGNTTTTGKTAQCIISNSYSTLNAHVYGITDLSTGRSSVYARTEIPAALWYGQMIIY